MNPLPVAVVGGDAKPFPETPEAVAATGLRVAVFCIGALVDPQCARNARAGLTQKASVQVRRLLLPSGVSLAVRDANEASVISPHPARMAVLKGTVTWWVTSWTESILPAAPQWIVKSAARARPAPMPSRLRIGALGTVA